ncbi:response regulator [Desulforhopalus singaporensis]|uniref:Response regulator receiver domain-containing protein n=1 Tax=Desulforhopalus singaporensis TaxID=91360 RepID=A0A1H0SXK9_9BACT|nr:response regulator [Desulforhopalus singaporensis]SDP46355.1 Response regulator receiver domain-containing protein [Desulforhopalus singaporensis]
MVEKVLLVDDELDFLEFLSARLRLRGVGVVVESSSRAAVSAYDAGNYDVVVLDVVMPAPDGFALYKRLRALDPYLQVIFVTGHGAVKDSVRAMKLGALDYLEKPLDIDEMCAKIRLAGARRQKLVMRDYERQARLIAARKPW